MPPGTDEPAVWEALATHGMVCSCEWVRAGEWTAGYTTHAEALVAAREGVWWWPSASVELRYKEAPYEARGWPQFESAVTCEGVSRALCLPRLSAELAKLPPKLIQIGTHAPRVVEMKAEKLGAGPRLERVLDGLRTAIFTRRDEQGIVIGLYRSHVAKITFAMAATSEGAYKGEINVAGEREGMGTLQFPHGNVYTGRWAAGKRDGWGKYWFVSGNVYEGEWKQGKAEGKGMCSFANGHVHEGGYRVGMREGWGIFRFVNGDMYEGEFRSNKMEGKGRFLFTSGDEYQGEFRADEMEGQGTFRDTSGRVWVSRFLADAMVGEGVQWSADRATAWRCFAGEAVFEIQLDEAARIAQALGRPVS